MADYTEKATLLLIDRSTTTANKINAALRRMRKEANLTAAAFNKLGGTKRSANNISALAKSVNELARASSKLKKIDLNVRLRGAAVKDVRAMARALAMYKSSAKGVNTILGVGGRNSNFKNLDALVAKLAKVARSASLAANQMARLKANIPTGRMGGGNFGVGRNGNYMFPRNIGLEIQPLKSFWRSAVVSLGHTIFNSIRNAFAEGVKGFDVAANKMAQQRLTAEQRQQFERVAFEGGQRFPAFRPDQRMDLYSEISTNFENPTDALSYDRYLERAIAVSIQQGQSVEEAITGLAALFRGLGQAGKLQDAQGNLDPQAFKFIEAYTAAKVSEGAQISWNDAFSFLKYSKTSGQSISPREFFYQLLAAADVGASTAGVQQNMLQKTFNGETTKKALAAQEAAGLRGDGRLVRSGQNSRGPTYSYEAGDLIDEELFRENTKEWISKYIYGPNGFLARQGIDVATAKPSTVISALDPLSGNRNSDDALAKAVLQMQEAMIKAEKYYDKPLTDTELNNISENSSWFQLQETSSQLVTAFGLLGDKLENIIIPTIDLVGDAAQRVTDFLQGKSRGEVQDYAFLGGAAVAGVGAGVGIAKILGGLWSLTRAGPQLQTAATMLQRAAVALGAPGAAPGGSGRNNGKAGWLGLLGSAGAILGLGAMQTGSSANNEYLNLDEAGRAKAREEARKASEARQKVIDQQSKIDSVLSQIAVLQGEIDFNKYLGRNDVAAQKQNELSNLDSYAKVLQEQMIAGTTSIQTAFETGASRVETAAESFGEQAATDLLSVASQFGSAAGVAMKNQFGTPHIIIPPYSMMPDTGTNTNLASGG